MSYDPQIKDEAVATLAAGITAGATSATLTTGHGAKLPDCGPWSGILWNSTDYAAPLLDPQRERVRVGGGYGTDALSSITRGTDGTAAVAHNTGGKVYKIAQVQTAAQLDDAPRALVKGLAGGTLSGAATGTAFAQLVLPANTLVPGSFLECYLRFTRTGSAASASGRVSLGAAVGGSFNIAAAEVTGVDLDVFLEVAAGGVITITSRGTRFTSAAVLTALPGSGTVDLATALTLSVEVGTTAINAGDSVTLNYWRVVHHKG